ncbi:MAG: DUF4446 family protein [Thermotaleaceae bacterium]
MNQVFAFIQENIALLVIYSGGLNLLALVIILIQAMKLSRLDQKYRELSRGVDNKSLEEIVHKYYDKIDQAEIRVNQVNKKVEEMDERLQKSVQKVGVVRYNAFDNTGGDLSFSIALLDEHHNGFIMTSIYGRNNSAMYAKPVKKGKSSYTLSAEELQALDRAKNNTLDEYGKMIS